MISELRKEGFLQQVTESGNYLKEKLEELQRSYPEAHDRVSGLGLMIGVFCKIDAGEFLSALKDEKLLLVKAGSNSVRILPALNVSRHEIDSALSIMDKVLSQI